MKISIITVCLNSQDTILYTFNSVITQTYKNIEHIIVDGGSEDATIELIKDYPLKKKKVFLKKNFKLYESLNYAIKNCTGDYILILHSDDILNNKNTLKKIVNELTINNCDVYLGNIVFFNKDFTDVNRYYKSENFVISDLKLGLMPPHTGSVVKTEIYKKNLFDKDYIIAGDFNFFNKIFNKMNLQIFYSSLLVTRMKVGGVSTKNLFSYLISTSEIYKSLKKNNFKVNYLQILFRFIFKINQFFFLRSKKNLKLFKINYHSFYREKLLYDFFIYKNFKNILNKKKFILSAMNLAFIGSYLKNNKLKFPNIIHWPDGVSAKIFNHSIIKIPGREILEKIKIPISIKRIIVIGNLTKKSALTLKKIYNKQIKNYKVPYGSVEFIYKNLKYQVRKNDLVFITLPTPKQELLGIKIAKNLDDYRIICIGGSISMLSGEERPVPKIFYNFEFLWRLRYETKRRILRLVDTFISVFFSYLINNRIKLIKIKYYR